ncbi:hypothetical protein [Natrinema salinisoli]|uniref:hypothetical protein n=1 Tax=Natrinema salinisoli TaxID=2878535 RepID=UPI001CF0AECC|nr:hypothetical protein [Natrinema salinisoli]
MADESILFRLNIIIVLLCSLLFVLLFSVLPPELLAAGLILFVLISPVILWQVFGVY